MRRGSIPLGVASRTSPSSNGKDTTLRTSRSRFKSLRRVHSFRDGRAVRHPAVNRTRCSNAASVVRAHLAEPQTHERTVRLLARSSALQAEETGSIPVPSTSTCRVSSSGRAPGFQPGGGGIVARTLLQAMSPWCSTAARRSPKPKDAVQSRAGMPEQMLRKRRQRRASLVTTRA